MRTKNIRIPFLTFLLFLHLPGISFAETIDRIVAKVNGTIITLSELETVVYSTVKGDKKSKSKLKRIFNKEKKKVLNKMIESKLQLQYAKQNKIEATRDDTDKAIDDIKKNNNFSDEMLNMMLEREGVTIDKYRASLKKQITLSKVLNYQINSRIKINEREVDKYYRKNKRKFLKPEEIRVYHIIFIIKNKEDKAELAKQKNKALQVLKLAKKGDDFEELAKTYSEGPSKDSGGDLGWVKKGSMIHAFEKVAFSLKKGAISNLVKTGYGYHIIKVEDRKEAKRSRLDEVRDEINNILFKKKYNNKYNKWIAELKKNAFIEIFLDKAPYNKYASLNKKKRRPGIRKKKSAPKETVRVRKEIKTRTAQKGTIRVPKEKNTILKSIRIKDQIKISKFILKWEKARETKNQRQYFSLYSKDFKADEMNRNEWKKATKEESEKYKFLDIEIRSFRIFKRNNFYVAAFDQRLKSNVNDQIRIVRLYLTKNKNGFEIAREKWLNSPDTNKEFSRKPLLTLDTLPKATSKITKKKKRTRMIQPLGLL